MCKTQRNMCENKPNLAIEQDLRTSISSCVQAALKRSYINNITSCVLILLLSQSTFDMFLKWKDISICSIKRMRRLGGFSQ